MNGMKAQGGPLLCVGWLKEGIKQPKGIFHQTAK